MTAIVLTTLGVYTFCVIALGFWANMKGLNTAEDYFVHSRSLSWGHLSITFLATWYSTIAFIGAPGTIFGNGIESYLMFCGFNLMTAFFIWFIGRKFWALGRTHNYITPGDLLGHQYQSRVLKFLTGIISSIGLFPYILIQLVAIGKVVDVATHGAVSYEAAVLAAGLTAAFYVISGGIRAVVWTDVLQGALFSLVVLVGFAAALHAVGWDIGYGFEASLAKNPEAFTVHPDKMGKPLTYILIWSFGGILLPHVWQRAYMARDARTISKTVVIHGTYTFFLFLFLMLTALLSIGFLEGVPEEDKFIPLLYAGYAPWALPLLVLATFAAGMSTVDSQLLTLSSVIIRDVLEVLTGRTLSPRREKLAGRIVLFIAIVILTIVAFLPESQGPIIALASRGMGIAFMLLVPVMGPLFWPRATRSGALWSLVVGVAVQAAFEFGLLGWEIPYDFGSPVVAFLLQIPVFIGFSVASQKIK